MLNNKKDLTGQVFGHLTVLKDDGHRTSQGGIRWLCQCDCGKKVYVASKDLILGHTKSCGHLKELDKKRLSQLNRQQLEQIPGTRANQLTDRPQENNQVGYRNIYKQVWNGKTTYHIKLTYKGVKHETNRKTLEEAIEVRDQWRREFWPHDKLK